MAEPIDLDQVVQEVLDAAQAARDSGVYPPGLEEQLQSDFARQLRRPDPRDRIVHLRNLMNGLRERHLSRTEVETTSSVPGGSTTHKAIGRVVGRQLDGTYQQLNDYHLELSGVLDNLIEGLEDPGSHVHSEMLRELDSLQDRVAELQLTIDSLGHTYREATAVMARLLDHLNSFDGLDARLAQLEEAERNRGSDR